MVFPTFGEQAGTLIGSTVILTLRSNSQLSARFGFCNAITRANQNHSFGSAPKPESSGSKNGAFLI